MGNSAEQWTNAAKALLAGVLGALAAMAQASWLGRDINGLAVAGSDASAKFLYDTDRSITWLRNATVRMQSFLSIR